jgi:hypothetical protein
MIVKGNFDFSFILSPISTTGSPGKVIKMIFSPIFKIWTSVSIVSAPSFFGNIAFSLSKLKLVKSSFLKFFLFFKISLPIISPVFFCYFKVIGKAHSWIDISCCTCNIKKIFKI